MARRLFIGKVGTATVIRQSKAGKDAKTGLLQDMIFDADHVTLLRVGTSTFNVPTRASGDPPTISVAHGIGYQPDLVVFLGRLEDTSSVAQNYYTASSAVISGITYTSVGDVLYDNADRLGQWCSPWHTSVIEVHPGTINSIACGYTAWWDATNLYAQYYGTSATAAHRLRIRWTAYRYK